MSDQIDDFFCLSAQKTSPELSTSQRERESVCVCVCVCVCVHAFVCVFCCVRGFECNRTEKDKKTVNATEGNSSIRGSSDIHHYFSVQSRMMYRVERVREGWGVEQRERREEE